MVDKTPRSRKHELIAPGSLKSIPETKLKAFEEGTMLVGKKGLSKREQEEQRRKQDQVAAAAVYEEFVASFSETSKQSKTWVKGETVNADKSKSADKSRLYKPTSKLAELASTFQSVKTQNDDKPQKVHLKKKTEEKKKSNLEMFKEELKRIQEDREERHRIKRIIRSGGDPGGGGGGGGTPPVVDDDRKPRFESEVDLMPGLGMYDQTNDETSTNIYVGNINPKMSEKQLMELFGRYGPLASIKIMWPRTDEEKSRGRNCGFVAFMNRKDGDRALRIVKGKEIMGFEMKLGWGKPVPIPPHPVYIPPALAELTLPPPPSGLPFNSQPQSTKRSKDGRGHGHSMPKNQEELEKTLSNAVVKVVIPTERNLLCVIHRMVEFVVREGPMFEAMIMNREINNPLFKFLFDNQSPAHIYYRWKLFSILNGDQPYKWRLDEFRMFKGGSYWRPPPMNPYTQGMPEELVDNSDEVELDVEVERENENYEPIKKGKLTDSQRDRLEDMLRELTPERSKVGDSMVWCLDHADSAEEVVECITESLSILQTPLPKKIARLFLVSDILSNSSAKVPNASHFRKQFQRKLPEIFRDVHETYDNIDGRLKAEQFKQKVMLCFRAWEDWAIYPNDYLINLQNIFLGLVPKDRHSVTPQSVKPLAPVDNPDIDGAPLPDIDIDGAPFMMEDRMSRRNRPADDATPRRSRKDDMLTPRRDRNDDFDGLPLPEQDVDGDPLNDEDSDVDGKPLDAAGPETEPPAKEAKLKFTKSKWETVDETELEAQAMTTSKWDLLGEDETKPENEEDLDGMPIEDDNIDGQEMSDDEYDEDKSQDSLGNSRHQPQEMTEERRRKLREIEVKVMKYQDDLESGRRSRKPNMSLSEQVQHHRKKLLVKEIQDSPSRESRKRHRSGSPMLRYDDKSRYDESPKRKRAKSPKKSRRSRSRSPHRRSRSRSPSRQRRKSKKNKHRE